LRIELAMTFKAVFPDILARDRSGHERPEASEAVSGCNILILRLDASAADPRFRPQLPQSNGGMGILRAHGAVH
jgi:hypothetical protein